MADVSGHRRVLMVSYFFPPYDSTAAVEAFKFATHLPTFGWDPTVISAANDFPATLPLEGGRLSVERTKQLDLNRPIKSLAGQRNVSVAGYLTDPRTLKGRLMAKGGRAYRNLIDFPDAQIGWYPFALRRAVKLLNSTRFDAILSSAYPVTNHLVARRASLRTGVPWLADFRDLWTDNHYFQRTRSLRPLEKRWERTVVADARALSAPSAEWAAILENRFAKPTAVVPNAFDPSDYPQRSAVPKKFTLTYTGVLYPRKQDAAPLLRAIAYLKQRNEISAGDFELRFVGRYVEGLRTRIVDLGIEDLVTVGPSIPHKDALGLQIDSTALLFLSWMHEEGKGWYSAKLYEYLGASRPILALGTPGAASQLIERVGAGEIVTSTADVVRVLSIWIAEFRRTGDLASPTTAKQRESFEWSAAVEVLARSLDSIAGTALGASEQGLGATRHP
jgi:hypothetical protein